MVNPDGSNDHRVAENGGWTGCDSASLTLIPLYE